MHNENECGCKYRFGLGYVIETQTVAHLCGCECHEVRRQEYLKSLEEKEEK